MSRYCSRKFKLSGKKVQVISAGWASSRWFLQRKSTLSASTSYLSRKYKLSIFKMIRRRPTGVMASFSAAAVDNCDYNKDLMMWSWCWFMMMLLIIVMAMMMMMSFLWLGWHGFHCYRWRSVIMMVYVWCIWQSGQTLEKQTLMVPRLMQTSICI